MTQDKPCFLCGKGYYQRYVCLVKVDHPDLGNDIPYSDMVVYECDNPQCRGHYLDPDSQARIDQDALAARRLKQLDSPFANNE